MTQIKTYTPTRGMLICENGTGDYVLKTEAEERHAKELQELKDKAVEAFIDNCPCRTPSGGCNFGNGNSPVCFKLECSDVYTFTQRLK